MPRKNLGLERLNSYQKKLTYILACFFDGRFIFCTFKFFAPGRQRKEAIQWLNAAIVQCMAKNKLAKPRLESLLTPKPLGHSPKPTNFGGRKNNLRLAANFRFRSNRMGSLIGEKRCLGNKCLHVLGRVTTSLTRQEECLLGSQNVSWMFSRRKNLFLRFISFTTAIVIYPNNQDEHWLSQLCKWNVPLRR